MPNLLRLAILSILCPASLHAQATAFTFLGEDTDDFFGHSVRGAGDVDADGVPDLVVGALGDDDGGFYSGSFRVLSGFDGSLIYFYPGDAPGDRLGRSVAGLGDLDGDGHAEFAAGSAQSSQAAQQAGLVRVYDGSDGSVRFEWTGSQANDEFGYHVAAVGDVDLDGVPDVIAGARQFISGGMPVGPGFARVYSGQTGAVLHTFSGDADEDQFGFAVAGCGDVDGDGRDDVIVGAPFSDAGGVDSGLARVHSGLDGSVLYTLVGDVAGDTFGFSVAGGRDVDGDGIPDFAVGAPNGQTGATSNGYVRVFSGLDGSVVTTLAGDDHEDRFGQAVALVDVDGVGLADYMIGADQDDENGPASGLVRAVRSSDDTTLFDLHGQGSELFGFSLGSVGDLNGDGAEDFVVGAWNASTPATTNSGYVQLLLGDVPGPVAYCTAKVNSLGCTPRISGSGVASTSLATAVTATAVDVLNSKPGLAFWSRGPAGNIPFFGATLCAFPPLLRTTIQLSNGSPPPAADCTGVYTYTFGATDVVQGNLSPGDSVFLQFWTRDPAHPDGTGVGLTDAVTFPIVP